MYLLQDPWLLGGYRGGFPIRPLLRALWQHEDTVVGSSHKPVGTLGGLVASPVSPRREQTLGLDLLCSQGEADPAAATEARKRKNLWGGTMTGALSL